MERALGVMRSVGSSVLGEREGKADVVRVCVVESMQRLTVPFLIL